MAKTTSGDSLVTRGGFLIFIFWVLSIHSADLSVS